MRLPSLPLQPPPTATWRRGQFRGPPAALARGGGQASTAAAAAFRGGAGALAAGPRGARRLASSLHAAAFTQAEEPEPLPLASQAPYAHTPTPAAAAADPPADPLPIDILADPAVTVPAVGGGVPPVAAPASSPLPPLPPTSAPVSVTQVRVCCEWVGGEGGAAPRSLRTPGAPHAPRSAVSRLSSGVVPAAAPLSCSRQHVSLPLPARASCQRTSLLLLPLLLELRMVELLLPVAAVVCSARTTLTCPAMTTMKTTALRALLRTCPWMMARE